MEPQTSTTPLLDREQPIAPVKRGRSTIVSLAIGAVLGVALIRWGGSLTEGDALGPLLLVVYLFAAIYLAVFVHEIGHVIAGLAAGFDLRGLVVCGFLLEKEARGWRLRFVPKRMFAVFGWAKMTPRSTDLLTKRYARLVLGGPAASVVLLLATLAIPGGHFGRMLLLVNLFLTVSCCIPYTTRGLSSDARFLMILGRKGVAAERLAATLYLIAIDARGVAPAEWPRELVEKINIPAKDTPLPAASLALKYGVVLDSGEPTAIAAVLEEALTLSDEMYPDVKRYFLVGASCFHASYRNQAALAEAWLQSAREVKCQVSQKDWDSKALAMIALAKGGTGAAKDFLARYLALVDSRPPCGMLLAERARTVALLDQLAEAPTETINAAR